MGEGPSPTGGWDAATMLRRVRKINGVGMAKPQGWRPGSSMGLCPRGGVTSTSALALSTARLCHFSLPASQLLSASISFPRSKVKEVIPILAGFFPLQDSTAFWSFLQAPSPRGLA